LPKLDLLEGFERNQGLVERRFIGSPGAKAAKQGACPAPLLDVKVLHVQRIVLDELAPRFLVLAYQCGQPGFGIGNVSMRRFFHRWLGRIAQIMPFSMIP